jgi:Subtilase family
MASLILHGDLNRDSPVGNHRLYVRPILRPDNFGTRQELAPEGVPWVDLIHRAVRRIVEGEGDQPAAAPTVKVINLSIGDPYQPFLRVMSPLARLLDWLAWRYQVLFVVSAGNHLGPLAMEGAATAKGALQAVAAERRHRRMLSPGEAINALTVGATSEDLGGAWLPRADGETDFAIPAGLPSPVSGWGRGYRRTVKPDLLAPGGRTVFVRDSSNEAGLPRYEPATRRARFPPGHRVASPGTSPGELTATRYSSGTSNSAALSSRLSTTIADTLEDLASEPNAERLQAVPTALWIRTLLAHGASWRPEAVEMLVEVLRAAGQVDPTTDDLAGILGFGRTEEERVVRCTPERATLLAGGSIRADERILHRLPLPSSLNAHTGWRRLTVTLSWFSPVHPGNRKYRRAQLWFEPPKEPLVVKRFGVDWQAAKRGTLQHEVLEGRQTAINIPRDATLEVPVYCVEDAGAFTEPIPYALAVTIEVGAGVNVHIYDEIRARIVPRVAVRP